MFPTLVPLLAISALVSSISSMIIQLLVILAKVACSSYSDSIMFGLMSALMLRILLIAVSPANTTRIPTISPLDLFNNYPFLLDPGTLSLLISSNNSHHPKVTLLSSILSIALANNSSVFQHTTTLTLQKSQDYSSIMSSPSMVFLCMLHAIAVWNLLHNSSNCLEHY